MRLIKKTFLILVLWLVLLFIAGRVFSFIDGKNLPRGFDIIGTSEDQTSLLCETGKRDCSSLLKSSKEKKEGIDSCTVDMEIVCDVVLIGESVLSYQVRKQYLLVVQLPYKGDDIPADWTRDSTTEEQYWAIDYKSEKGEMIGPMSEAVFLEFVKTNQLKNIQLDRDVYGDW